MEKLPYDFYNRHGVTVAQELLGKTLVVGQSRGIITETEAYRGSDDEASHAFRGPTPRSAIMFGPAGYAYVYMIYGMYFCLNLVTEAEGCPSAVLIRGLDLPSLHLDGPGKLCRHLGITKAHHGLSVVDSEELYLVPGGPVERYTATPRIGIRQGLDKLWRFVVDPPLSSLLA